jgi:hypothetical protein
VVAADGERGGQVRNGFYGQGVLVGETSDAVPGAGGALCTAAALMTGGSA